MAEWRQAEPEDRAAHPLNAKALAMKERCSADKQVLGIGWRARSIRTYIHGGEFEPSSDPMGDAIRDCIAAGHRPVAERKTRRPRL
jgi:hypothetical protein